jgi:hypothetical protein
MGLRFTYDIDSICCHVLRVSLRPFNHRSTLECAIKYKGGLQSQFMTVKTKTAERYVGGKGKLPSGILMEGI